MLISFLGFIKVAVDEPLAHALHIKNICLENLGASFLCLGVVEPLEKLVRVPDTPALGVWTICHEPFALVGFQAFHRVVDYQAKLLREKVKLVKVKSLLRL